MIDTISNMKYVSTFANRISIREAQNYYTFFANYERDQADCKVHKTGLVYNVTHKNVDSKHPFGISKEEIFILSI